MAISSLGEADRAKHLHDYRGTFVTHLCRTDPTMTKSPRDHGGSPAHVESIRRTYVDDAAIVVPLADRIKRAVV